MAGKRYDTDIEPMRLSLLGAIKLRLLLGGIVTLLASGCQTLTEARYAVLGHTTIASITEIASAGSKSGERRAASIKYEFADGESPRQDTLEGPFNVPDSLAVGSLVEIQYVSGEVNDSRLLGQRKLWLTVPVLLAFAAVCVASWRFWAEYAEHQRLEKLRNG